MMFTSPIFVMTNAGCRWLMLLLGLISLSALAQQSSVQNEAALPKFDILEYRVEGNSRLPELKIEHAVMPFLGEEKSLREVEAARANLEKTYHDAGYLTVVVSIPEQNVDVGIVTLRVVEGTVERLHVKGSEYHLPSEIRQQVPELAEGNVPYFPEMQRQLDTLNRSPDMKATPVLKAGKVPGTVDVSLDVDDHLPLHGNLEFSNRQTPYTEPQRLSASIHYDNLWQLGHSVTLSAQTAPQDPEQLKVWSATYVMPLGKEGDALALYGVHSSSNVPSFPTGVLGNTNIFGLRYVVPLQATADYSQSLSLGIDRKYVEQSIVLDSPSGPTSPSPSIAYVPLAASYNGSWLEQGGSTAIDATATLGMRSLFGNRDTDFAAKRSGASANFLSLKTGLQQVETFKRWSLSGKLDLQFASGPLIPNEQYAAGGADTVRGYLESERIGDDAVRIGIELRTPQWQLGSETSPLRISGLGFYDAARLRTRQPVFPQPEYYLLRGMGVGLRITGWRGFNFDLDWAVALDDGQVTHAGDHRLQSRLTWDF